MDSILSGVDVGASAGIREGVSNVDDNVRLRAPSLPERKQFSRRMVSGIHIPNSPIRQSVGRRIEVLLCIDGSNIQLNRCLSIKLSSLITLGLTAEYNVHS